MNESVGNNGGVRILDEFVCTAISHDIAETPPSGHGENAGFRVATSAEPFCDSSHNQLRQLSTEQLRALVVMEGCHLPKVTLKLIHDIALERLSLDQTNRDPSASILSNIVMEQAVARIVASAT